jgi:hypothetical protein
VKGPALWCPECGHRLRSDNAERILSPELRRRAWADALERAQLAEASDGASEPIRGGRQ